MSSMQARLTQALPATRKAAPLALMGPDWFDLVRQAVVSKYLLSRAFRHAPSGSVGNSTAAWVQSSDILFTILKVLPQL